jgi:hypothetical protein
MYYVCAGTPHGRELFYGHGDVSMLMPSFGEAWDGFRRSGIKQPLHGSSSVLSSSVPIRTILWIRKEAESGVMFCFSLNGADVRRVKSHYETIYRTIHVQISYQVHDITTHCSHLISLEFP